MYISPSQSGSTCENIFCGILTLFPMISRKLTVQNILQSRLILLIRTVMRRACKESSRSLSAPEQETNATKHPTFPEYEVSHAPLGTKVHDVINDVFGEDMKKEGDLHPSLISHENVFECSLDVVPTPLPVTYLSGPVPLSSRDQIDNRNSVPRIVRTEIPVDTYHDTSSNPAGIGIERDNA